MEEKQKRGFALMDPEKRKLVAASGGKSAHAKGVAHRFTQDEAKIAGKKGGSAPHKRAIIPAAVEE